MPQHTGSERRKNRANPDRLGGSAARRRIVKRLRKIRNRAVRGSSGKSPFNFRD